MRSYYLAVYYTKSQKSKHNNANSWLIFVFQHLILMLEESHLTDNPNNWYELIKVNEYGKKLTSSVKYCFLYRQDTAGEAGTNS